MALVKCPCAFWLRRLAQNRCRAIGVQNFYCNFPHAMALVTCPWAFRLRRLAQSVLPGLGIGLPPQHHYLPPPPPQHPHHHLPPIIIIIMIIITIIIIIITIIFIIIIITSISSSPPAYHHHNYSSVSFPPSTLFGVSCRDAFYLNLMQLQQTMEVDDIPSHNHSKSNRLAGLKNRVQSAPNNTGLYSLLRARGMSKEEPWTHEWRNNIGLLACKVGTQTNLSITSDEVRVVEQSVYDALCASCIASHSSSGKPWTWAVNLLWWTGIPVGCVLSCAIYEWLLAAGQLQKNLLENASPKDSQCLESALTRLKERTQSDFAQREDARWMRGRKKNK